MTISKIKIYNFKGKIAYNDKYNDKYQKVINAKQLSSLPIEYYGKSMSNYRSSLEIRYVPVNTEMAALRNVVKRTSEWRKEVEYENIIN